MTVPFPGFPAPNLELRVKPLVWELTLLNSHCCKLTSSQVALLGFGGAASTRRASLVPLAKHQQDCLVFNKDAQKPVTLQGVEKRVFRTELGDGLWGFQ